MSQKCHLFELEDIPVDPQLVSGGTDPSVSY